MDEVLEVRSVNRTASSRSHSLPLCFREMKDVKGLVKPLIPLDPEHLIDVIVKAIEEVWSRKHSFG